MKKILVMVTALVVLFGGLVMVGSKVTKHNNVTQIQTE